MNGSLHRIRRQRSLLALVAITWLPFISVLCVEGPANGCPTLAAGHEQEAVQEHHHASHAHDQGQADHDHEKSGAPEHTCCQLTGKCAVELSSPTSSAPAIVAVTWIRTPNMRPAAVSVRPAQYVADPTHHPPPYLRFATLLI